MLSDREQQELQRIEEALKADDKTRRWPARALLGFGIALIVIGALTSAVPLILEGILFTGIGVAWIRWEAVRAGRANGDGRPVRPAGRPDGPNPGFGQPV